MTEFKEIIVEETSQESQNEGNKTLTDHDLVHDVTSFVGYAVKKEIDRCNRLILNSPVTKKNCNERLQNQLKYLTSMTLTTKEIQNDELYRQQFFHQFDQIYDLGGLTKIKKE